LSERCIHLDGGDREIEAAVEAAARLTADTLDRWR